MRARVEIKWFAACATWAQVKELYKVLSKKHHPDRGGDLRAMQEINAEYDELKRNPSRIGTASRDASGWSGWKSPGGDRSGSKGKPRGADSSASSGASACAGVHTVIFTEVIHKPEKSYVALVFDIAEGPHARRFRFESWWRHCIYLKYEGEDWQLRNAVSVLEKISASNAGFDALEAFEDDDFDEFIGKRVAVDLTADYMRNGGFIKEWQVHVL